MAGREWPDERATSKVLITTGSFLDAVFFLFFFFSFKVLLVEMELN